MAVASRHTGKYIKYCVNWNNISKGTRLKVHDSGWFDVNSSECIEEFGGKQKYYRLVCTSLDGIKLEVSFIGSMIDMCGGVVTVYDIRDNHIVLEGDEFFCWYPEMFECVVP